MLVYLFALQSRGMDDTVTENPFHLYFSVVPREQDELSDIILH